MPHRRSIGRTTELRLYQFLRDLFERNENDRRPDGQIELAVRIEFESFPEVIESIENCSKSRIQLWRYRYNTGVMGGVPERFSFRYNSEGKPISPYSGKPLTSDEVLSAIEKLKGRTRAKNAKSRRTRKAAV